MKTLKKKNYQIIVYDNDDDAQNVKLSDDTDLDYLSCNICGYLQHGAENLLSMKKYKCCNMCYNDWGFLPDLRDQFLTGNWRPSKDMVEEKLKSRIIKPYLDT